MPICVGVVFKRVARSYWFDSAGLDFDDDDRVMVETSHGVELATVKIAPREVPDDEIQTPLKSVLRRADEADLERDRANRERAAHALEVCAESVRRLKLPMRLLQAEYSFDGVQVTISFSAETRVDFRELVRDVAGQLRSKVQLHQVGARDQAKMIGGFGPCGLALCCATFLTDFAPISMKMAKDQSLFLNPVKFSGVCGRLMCCLRYEHETYVDVKKRMPAIGEVVLSPRGKGKVAELNLLKETVLVELLESHVELEFPTSELTLESAGRCGTCRRHGADGEHKCELDTECPDAGPERASLRRDAGGRELDEEYNDADL